MSGLAPDDILSIQERIGKRVLWLIRAKGLLDSDAASDMLDWENGGFALNANVRIEPYDRDGLERLIRYCARPVFSSECLDVIGEKLRCILPKPTPDGQTMMLLKPSELLHKLAQLIPPPKRHRHQYHGILAPHSPLRPKVTNNSLPIRSPNENNPVQKEDLPFLLPEPLQELQEKTSSITQLPSSQPDIAPM